MKKMLKTCAFISALLISVPAIFGIARLCGAGEHASKADVNAKGSGALREPAVYVPTGDLKGGVRGVEDAYGGFMIKQTVNLVDCSDSDLYIRIKNNEDVTRWPMIHVASDWFVNRVVTAGGQVVDRYKADGTFIDSVTVNEWGYFELPASFDGFIKLHWDGFKNDWATAFSNERVCSVYYESDHYDVSIGDIFTENGKYWDGSEHYAEEFPSWVETWTGATCTLLEGSKVDAYVPVGDLNGGVRGVEAAYGGFMVKQTVNLVDCSDSDLYIRIKNNEAVIRWPMIHVASDWFVNRVVTAGGQQIDYYNADGELTGSSFVNEWGYFELPASFDGFIKVYWEGFKNDWGTEFSNARVCSVYFESDHYDVSIGDIFTEGTRYWDGSEHYAEDYPSWVETWTGATLTLLEGSKTDEFAIAGDFLGGVRCLQNGYGGFMIKSTGVENLSDDVVYITIKNNKADSSWVMIHVASDFFANRKVTANGQVISRFNAAGEADGSSVVNEWGYFELPGNFNGFLKFTISELANDANWPASDLHLNAISAIYFEADGLSVDVGDIFTEKVHYFDGSELYAAAFTNWAETWTGAALTLLEGSKPAPFVPYDYTNVEFEIGLERGVQVSAKQNPDSAVFSTASMNFASNLDLSAGEAVAISFKSNGTYAFGLEFYDKDGNVLMMPAKGNALTKQIYFLVDGVQNTINHTTGDENTIHGQSGEGTLIVEKAFLAQKAGEGFDWASVASIKVRVHTFYDHGIIDVFGDIGTVDQTAATYTKVFDVSELTNWSSYFVADDEFMVVKQYTVPKASNWIGDVKIIDSLTYIDDEEMYKAINLDDGDNPCSIERKESGIKVHAGPYETGHAYGSYMCLGLFDKGATTDRAQAYKMVGEEKVYAKGLTFFAKNLSAKEIGVTLQFDEKIPGKSHTERWCIVGYPAIYYAYDVNTGAEYMMYSKSDQVQIPVGFEGYIRVPFESYSVPDWNKGQEGVDEILDLDNFSGDFFFTSDNKRYEDLEWELKDIGMYFNETRKGNMFDNSHTIKANMGL